VSCGEAHDVDCAKVIEQVYLYLDGELPDDGGSQVRHHLEECAPCLREYGLEQEFKAFVARSCRCEDTPPEVKERLLARLREVRAEIAQVEYQPE
jgi:mycothiol system anti-sigma-R factor